MMVPKKIVPIQGLHLLFVHFYTSLFLRGGFTFFFILILSLPYPKGMAELVLLFAFTIKQNNDCLRKTIWSENNSAYMIF